MFRRWHEQRLGRHQTTASAGAGATRVVAPPHRAGDHGPPRNGERLSRGRRGPGPRARRATSDVAANPATTSLEVSTDLGPSNRQFQGRCPPTLAGQNRPPRRRCPPTSRRRRARDGPRARAHASRTARSSRRAGPWSQRRRHLAGPRRRSRLSGALRQCPAVRLVAARPHAHRGPRGLTTAPVEEGQVILAIRKNSPDSSTYASSSFLFT